MKLKHDLFQAAHVSGRYERYGESGNCDDGSDEPFAARGEVHRIARVVGDPVDDVRGGQGAVARIGVVEDSVGYAGFRGDEAPIGDFGG